MTRRRATQYYTGDPAAQAAEYRAEAGRTYKHGRTDARRAADFYQVAANRRRQAAWLTRRPDLWDDIGTPAQEEAAAESLARVADLFLHRSFAATDRAADARALARRYDAIAARARSPGDGMTGHRATWWVYAGTERIRHTAAMRGSWGYDVTCSCGWDSKTGGALRRYVAGKLEDHRDDTGRTHTMTANPARNTPDGPGASKDAGRPSSLAMNPRNREASAGRRARLLAAFRTLDDTTHADLLEAVESLAGNARGADMYRDEARAIIHRVYAAAGWDDGRARAEQATTR